MKRHFLSRDNGKGEEEEAGRKRGFLLAETARDHHLVRVFFILAQGQTIEAEHFLWLAVALTSCFLLGSIPFGYLVGKWNGVDIRKSGSGNIGATNVLRVLGKKWGTVVFVLDFLKAWIPLFLITEFPIVGQYWGGISFDLGLLLCGIAVVLGHNYTPFLGFRGGKGITSSAGVLLALMPIAFLASAVTWLALFYGTRYVSVASLGASVVLPLATLLAYWEHPLFIVLSLLMMALSLWRHRTNMQRLWAGTEHRFSKKKS